MNRRNFLRGLLGSVLAAPFVGIAKAAGYDISPLAIQSYQVNDLVQETLREIGRLRFEEICNRFNGD